MGTAKRNFIVLLPPQIFTVPDGKTEGSTGTTRSLLMRRLAGAGGYRAFLVVHWRRVLIECWRKKRLQGQRRGSTVKAKSILFRGWLAASIAVFNICAAAAQEKGGTKLGVFESSGDVGTVLHAGSVEYDAAKGTYTIAGSGENMWFGKDAYQFVWKKMSGDLTLSADIAFVGSGGNAHRKAVLMIRQSLDEDSVYVDIAGHGNGMTGLQFRTEKGGLTSEVQSPNWGPAHLRIEKHGAYATMWLATESGGELKIAGASPRIELKEPFYVGIGVCSHDKDVVEKAVFSNVKLMTMKSPAVASTANEKS